MKQGGNKLPWISAAEVQPVPDRGTWVTARCKEHAQEYWARKVPELVLSGPINPALISGSTQTVIALIKLLRLGCVGCAFLLTSLCPPAHPQLKSVLQSW